MHAATKRAKLRYSAEDFPRYEQQLRALCLKSAGGWILSKLVTNPIDEFVSQNKDEFLAETPTAQQVSVTAETISNLLEEIASPSSTISAEATPARSSDESKKESKLRKPTDEQLKLNPEEVGYKFLMEVKAKRIGTEKQVAKLHKDLCA